MAAEDLGVDQIGVATAAGACERSHFCGHGRGVGRRRTRGRVLAHGRDPGEPARRQALWWRLVGDELQPLARRLEVREDEGVAGLRGALVEERHLAVHLVIPARADVGRCGLGAVACARHVRGRRRRAFGRRLWRGRRGRGRHRGRDLLAGGGTGDDRDGATGECRPNDGGAGHARTRGRGHHRVRRALGCWTATANHDARPPRKPPPGDLRAVAKSGPSAIKGEIQSRPRLAEPVYTPEATQGPRLCDPPAGDLLPRTSA